MRQQPIKGRYGFVFHDACWSLLAAAYHPESVPLQRLYDACRSVPIDRSVLDWGHDYGGMISRYSDAAYSWETASFGREVKLPFVDDNPFIAPQVQHPFDHGPADDLPGLASEPQRWPVSQDPFSQLPEELLVAIAELLPTKDFLSSRLASPAFFPAFNNQSFWHSRFTHTRIGERSWLFEARDYRTARVDWRWLYRQTASSRLEPGLLNRKRIWDLVGRLRPVLGLYQGPIMESSEEASYSWVGAAAELYDLDSSYSGRWFDEGAKAIFRTSVILPTSQPFHFVFYFITLGDARFICGIELIADKANEGHLLGYRSAASMSCYDPANTSSKLTGFILAIHPRGFRAVRLLYEKGDMPSQWYGDAQHCPRTQRASVSGPVSAMRVSFDVCIHSHTHRCSVQSAVCMLTVRFLYRDANLSVLKLHKRRLLKKSWRTPQSHHCDDSRYSVIAAYGSQRLHQHASA